MTKQIKCTEQEYLQFNEDGTILYINGNAKQYIGRKEGGKINFPSSEENVIYLRMVSKYRGTIHNHVPTKKSPYIDANCVLHEDFCVDEYPQLEIYEESDYFVTLVKDIRNLATMSKMSVNWKEMLIEASMIFPFGILLIYLIVTILKLIL